jgi:hypothetical protein
MYNPQIGGLTVHLFEKFFLETSLIGQKSWKMEKDRKID